MTDLNTMTHTLRALDAPRMSWTGSAKPSRPGWRTSARRPRLPPTRRDRTRVPGRAELSVKRGLWTALEA